ncbi:MAG: rane bound protein mediates protein-protein interaction [Deltaproteobacteria bacterium]|jgi:tetratricopeptide (TPR) repeat protein|nr:rane bound protein mediates protein-protein interaction [Deltaproteobacteria bacterium]
MSAKVTKKDMEKPDPFYEFMERIYGYLAEHRKKFYIAAGLLAGLIVLTTGFFFYSRHVEQQAEKLYLKAYEIQYSTANLYTNREALTSVMAAYEEVIKIYPRSSAAANAHYMLGNLYYRIGDYDKSQSSFEAFLDKASRNHVLTPFAHTGLGYCHEEKREYEKALAAFEKAVQKDTGGLLAGVSYGNMARIYEEMKNPEKALELYQKALEKISDPSMAAFIKRKIASLSL